MNYRCKFDPIKAVTKNCIRDATTYSTVIFIFCQAQVIAINISSQLQYGVQLNFIHGLAINEIYSQSAIL